MESNGNGLDLATQLGGELGALFSASGLDAGLGKVQRAGKPEFGDFQCNGAMAGAKQLGLPPRELAVRMAAGLVASDQVATCEIAGPGFLNIRLKDAALAERAQALSADPRAGAGLVDAPQRVIIDYAGPNVAKPMHVGHLRATIIGDALKRVFRFRGHQVWGDSHFGDWGFQMGLLISVLEEQVGTLADPALGQALDALTLEDLEQMYPPAAARAKEDSAFRDKARRATAALQAGDPVLRRVWQRMKDVSMVALKREFAALGVTFDLWYGESDADPFIPAVVADLDARGLLVDDDGARVVFVHDKLVPKKEGGEGPNLPPLLVVSSEGSAMYGTTDLATIWQRVADFAPDQIIYCVDQRQAEHFEQVFRTVTKAGWIARDRLDHIGFGTMNGPDGKPFKTRAGGVLKLADLIANVREKALAKVIEAGVGADLGEDERIDIATKVGMAALKFADLQNFRGTSYVFDLDRFLSFEGKTGPYLLYAAVRIKSILRKARESAIMPGPVQVSESAERALVLALDGFDQALAATCEKRAPHILAEHVYELAQAFSAFYANCPILPEPDNARRASRLSLAATTLRQLETGLDLLGISVPERM